MYITEIITEKKGKLTIHTEEGITFPLYRKEANTYGIEEGVELSQEQWEQLCREVLFKRATKRAMFLLQKMDRTESQLRRKLKENGYPEEVVTWALDYVKSYHYVDDLRYAKDYIRYHQESKSKLQLKNTLMQKGISSQLIAEAMEEEYSGEEQKLVMRLLEKKHYDAEHMTREEKQKIYAFLMRKGFSDSVIRHCMEG